MHYLCFDFSNAGDIVVQMQSTLMAQTLASPVGSATKARSQASLARALHGLPITVKSLKLTTPQLEAKTVSRAFRTPVCQVAPLSKSCLHTLTCLSHAA